MNRTDRLLAIVLELQGKGKQRAEDLARTFETSKRTIYRDVEALCEAGVPLISVPGQGYSLMKGYFLPPLSFTTDEAIMLLLGSDFMAQNFDAQYRIATQSASRKIEGILPEQSRDEVRYLQNIIRFIAGNATENAAQFNVLLQLRRAILERTTVRFHYHTRHSRESTRIQGAREADPYGLVHTLNSWYLTAYCHIRQGIRIFRVERIDALELLPRTFTRPADFQMLEHQGGERNLTVRVLFDKEIARWVRESRFYYVVAEEETAEGLLVALRIRQESEVIQWLLSWGRHVRVLEPESLRRQLVEEAQGMLQNHQHPQDV